MLTNCKNILSALYTSVAILLFGYEPMDAFLITEKDCDCNYAPFENDLFKWL